MISRFRNTLGLPGHLLCACSPITPPTTCAASPPACSTACSYGSGDATVGINPASDSLPTLMRLWQMMDEVRQHFDIP